MTEDRLTDVTKWTKLWGNDWWKNVWCNWMKTAVWKRQKKSAWCTWTKTVIAKRFVRSVQHVVSDRNLGGSSLNSLRMVSSWILMSCNKSVLILKSVEKLTNQLTCLLLNTNHALTTHKLTRTTPLTKSSTKAAHDTGLFSHSLLGEDQKKKNIYICTYKWNHWPHSIFPP